MTLTVPSLDSLTLNVSLETHVRASLEATFDALLEQIGPGNETPDGKPLPMMHRSWPGGRWFRDLGQGNGHFWGHVQAIKRPTLMEITGPLFMSTAVVSNVQYRLKEVDGGTLISISVGRLMACTWPQKWPLPWPRSRNQRPPGHGFDRHRQRLAVRRFVGRAHLLEQRVEGRLERCADVHFLRDVEGQVVERGCGQSHDFSPLTGFASARSLMRFN